MVGLDLETTRGLRWAAAVVVVALAGLALAGCKTNSQFCCSTIESCEREDGSSTIVPCTDPERPYCDDEGLFSGGRVCVPDPMGQPCRGPEHCSAERPYCIDQLCVECEEDSQCGAATPACNETTHLCEGCSADEDCSASAGTPRCLVEEGTCVACVGREDCDEDAPVCAANECVGCAGPEDCGGATPVCEANTCRGCAGDSECASDVCDEEGGACFDEAAIIYVSTDGQATGTCTRAAPCNSFALALRQVTSERNIVKAAPGMYMGPVDISGVTATILADGVTVSPAGANQTVVSVSGGGNATIEGLTVTGALGTGNTIAVTCTASTLRLRRSTVIANTGGGGISISGCEFSLVNNVIALNGSVTSAFGGVSIAQVATEGLHEFSFNTVTGNGGATNAVTGVECASILMPVTFSNNIVYGNQVSGTGTQVGGDSECSWTYSDVGPETVDGTGNINEDPQFVDAENRDFHLKRSSPARNAADPAASIARDIDGDPRGAGGRSDTGADEFRE